jgi:anti-anti-sigma factor
MSKALLDLTPEEQDLLKELGQQLEEYLPTLEPQWQQELDALFVQASEWQKISHQSLVVARKLLRALAAYQPDDLLEQARSYGETLASLGLSHSLLGEWLSVLRQSLLSSLALSYAEDIRLGQAVLILSQVLAFYILQVTESFGSQQQHRLLEQQEALSQAYEQTQRQLEELEVLNQVGRAISSTMELDDVLELIYQQTSRLMDTTNFFIALYDSENELFHFEVDVEDGKRLPRDKMALGEGLTSHIVRTGQPLLLPDGPDEFLREQGIERVGRPSKSWLGVPMLSQERVIGIITVQSYDQEGAYDEDHLHVLSTIASQAAVAVENARFYQEAQRRADETEALYRIGATAASHLSLQEILQSIYEQASVVMDTSAFYVAFYDPEQDEISFELVYDKGLKEEPFRRNKARQGGLTGWLLERGETLLVRNWQEEATDELRQVAIRDGEEAGSYLGVPIKARGKTIGVIATQSYENEAFDEHHQRILEMIAHQAAGAIESARLYQEAQSRIAALSALQQIGLKLAATTELSEVLDTIAESAIELLEPNGVQIFIYDAVSKSFTLGVGLEATGEQGLFTPMPREDGLTAKIAQTGEMTIVEDVSTHPLYTGMSASERGQLCSIVGVPLRRAGEVLGVFNAFYYTPHRFDDTELRLLRSFADQAAVAVTNARLFQQTQTMMKEMIETTESQSHLLSLIQELSTPVVPLMEGVLVMPLIGSIDSQRGQQILDRVLKMVEHRQAKVVLIDITGVPVVDTSVAQILLQTIQAVGLLGGEAVLVGITPEVAQTLISLGVELSGITTRSDLQGGVLYALRRVGHTETARALSRSLRR